MKVVVDSTVCTGHGRCAALAPEVYDLAPDGYNRMGEFEVSPELEDAARRGAINCPERAITIVE